MLFLLFYCYHPSTTHTVSEHLRSLLRTVQASGRYKVKTGQSFHGIHWDLEKNIWSCILHRATNTGHGTCWFCVVGGAVFGRLFGAIEVRFLFSVFGLSLSGSSTWLMTSVGSVFFSVWSTFPLILVFTVVSSDFSLSLSDSLSFRNIFFLLFLLA